MNVLIAGGAGSVGQDLAEALLKKGHQIRVFDKRSAALPRGIEFVQGRLEDSSLVAGALRGVDTVVNLAWSFSDNPAELLDSDLKGHVALLEACAAAGISRLVYASTAVVYGKPVQVPIVEDAPCLVEEARKPFYAVAKLSAEKLALAYWTTRKVPVTIFRFWWSFGQKIGGRHLRDMMTQAQAGQLLAVPADAGGSFLDHDDLTHALLLSLQQPGSIGQIFNLSTVYLEWRDVAQMIIEAAGSSSRLEVVPPAAWHGAQFLSDRWDLSAAKAEKAFGYRSLFTQEAARQRLLQAIRRGREDVKAA